MSIIGNSSLWSFIGLRGCRWVPTVGVLFAALVTTGVAAEVIRVPGDHDTIQEALDAAADGDTIRIGSGVHAIEAILSVKDKSLVIEGTMDEQGKPTRIVGAGDHRLFEAEYDGVEHAAATSLVLRDLAFENGFCGPSSDSVGAGGATISGCDHLTIERCRFERNRWLAFDYARGGGLRLSRVAEAALVESVFEDNLTESRQSAGGGVHVFGGDETATVTRFERCRFEGNVSQGRPGDPEPSGFGGALNAVMAVAIELIDCELLRNEADKVGAMMVTGFFVPQGLVQVELRGCRIEGNRSVSSNGVGACVFRDGRILLEACTIQDNHGMGLWSVGGVQIGGHYKRFAEGLIDSCVISDNTAPTPEGSLAATGGLTVGDGSTGLILDSRLCGNHPNQLAGFGEVTLVDGTSVLADCDTACAGDVDANGMLDATDFGTLLASWGLCLKCPPDVDGNGVVDGRDLGLLLENWGPCR